MNCRTGCGACCIAPAISSPIPGMLDGKPAGVTCIQLDSEYRCKLFDSPLRPDVCEAFLPDKAVCGDNALQALRIISRLEVATKPDIYAKNC